MSNTGRRDFVRPFFLTVSGEEWANQLVGNAPSQPVPSLFPAESAGDPDAGPDPRWLEQYKRRPSGGKAVYSRVLSAGIASSTTDSAIQLQFRG